MKSETSDKRKLSGPNSDQKPEKKKGRDDMEVEEPEGALLGLVDNDAFASPAGDELLYDDEANQGQEVAEDEKEAGEREAANMEGAEKGVVERGEPEKNKKTAAKRAAPRERLGTGKKKKNAIRSRFLVTITKTDVGPIGVTTFNKLVKAWNDEIFENIKEGRTSSAWIPKIDFTNHHSTRILVGCADAAAVQWIMEKVRESGEDLEAWDRNTLLTFTTYIPKPTSERDTQELLQAIAKLYNIPGSIVQLKNQETNNGRIVVVGMTPSAREFLEGMDFTVHVGLCRIKFAELKHREEMELE